MANIDSRQTHGSPSLENLPFFLAHHSAMMNSFPTSVPLPTDRFVGHRHYNPGFRDGGPLRMLHEKPEVPLRQRHLPASFWKEPNVPRFSVPANCLGVFPSYWNPENMEYKDLFGRIQSAQLHGMLNPHGSRFPITEFLYYNYGLKSLTESTENHSGGDISLFHGQPRHCKKQHSGVPISPRPQVCPYIGCACSNSNSESITTSERTVMLQSPVWKPVATKSSSSPPNRFHPFAHAR